MPIEIAYISVDGLKIDEKTKSEHKADPAVLMRMYNEKKPMFVKFFANWCGHCKTLDPIWQAMVKTALKELKDANIAIVSVESKVVNKSIDELQTQAKFKVDGFPTIGTIINGKFTAYTGERTEEALLKHIKDKLVPAVKSAAAMPVIGFALSNTKNKTGGKRMKRSTQKRSTQKRSTQKRSTQKRKSRTKRKSRKYKQRKTR
jgi:thiol-disulfide isomerase/thioredoxin